jgi:glycosyltransferase involved in cell wall biosynthesis
VKIVMFSINPLWQDRVMGGAPKHLQNIAIHMGELGHDVVVLATQRDADQQPFKWHERVQVKPVLPFHQPFPQPYAVPAYDMASVLQSVGEHLADADRFYMHDGEFLFPYAYQHVPTVVSLRDNVYPETLLGGFLFQGDQLVLISDYARLYFEQTVGRFFPDLHERITVIRNGLDWSRFRPTQPVRILELVNVNPADHAIVLHPHRPEETKGIWQTIAVADQLVHRYDITNLRVLVPQWIDYDASDDLRNFYRRVKAEIERHGLGEHFVFHEWVPQELMPEYYSLGRVTLALGSFVESFGNAVYESLGCGTAVVVARISSHRELLPDHLVDKVDFNDNDRAARRAAEIIQQRHKTRPDTLAYLHEHYSVRQQLERYSNAILNAQRREPMRYQLTPLGETTQFALPVWCYPAKHGIYHDFHGDYSSEQALRDITERYPNGFTLAQARTAGIEERDVMDWYRAGFLYPITARG